MPFSGGFSVWPGKRTVDNGPGKPVLGCDGCQLLKTAGRTGCMFCLTQTQLEADFL